MLPVDIPYFEALRNNLSKEIAWFIYYHGNEGLSRNLEAVRLLGLHNYVFIRISDLQKCYRQLKLNLGSLL